MYKQQIKSGALGTYDLDYQYAKCQKKKERSKKRKEIKREINKFKFKKQDRSHFREYGYRLKLQINGEKIK